MVESRICTLPPIRRYSHPSLRFVIFTLTDVSDIVNEKLTQLSYVSV